MVTYGTTKGAKVFRLQVNSKLALNKKPNYLKTKQLG